MPLMYTCSYIGDGRMNVTVGGRVLVRVRVEDRVRRERLRAKCKAGSGQRATE